MLNLANISEHFFFQWWKFFGFINLVAEECTKAWPHRAKVKAYASAWRYLFCSFCSKFTKKEISPFCLLVLQVTILWVASKRRGERINNKYYYLLLFIQKYPSFFTFIKISQKYFVKDNYVNTLLLNCLSLVLPETVLKTSSWLLKPKYHLLTWVFKSVPLVMYFPHLSSFRKICLAEPCLIRETESPQTQPGCKKVIAMHMHGLEAEKILTIHTYENLCRAYLFHKAQIAGTVANIVNAQKSRLLSVRMLHFHK